MSSKPEHQNEEVRKVPSHKGHNRGRDEPVVVIGPTNNNDDTCNKRQKETLSSLDNNDSDSDSYSLPTSTDPVVLPVIESTPLSFGNVLQRFPDFLIYVLSYIADRTVFNSLASSNKDMYTQSKTILPPWPNNNKMNEWLTAVGRLSWSPCGTRIAGVVKSNIRNEIEVFDQRRGPLHRWTVCTTPTHHLGRNCISDLKFSPNGSFLVSASAICSVKLWSNDATGNYELLHEQNFGPEIRFHRAIVTVSACSRYIVVSFGGFVFLLDVHDGCQAPIASFVRRSQANPHGYRLKTMFSLDGRAIFFGCTEHDTALIKIWRPFLDVDDDNRLITIGEQTVGAAPDNIPNIEFGRDNDNNNMVAVTTYSKTTNEHKRTVWSIDIDHNRLVQKSKFDTPTYGGNPLFTPDGKYIVYNTEMGQKLWSTAEYEFTDNKIHILRDGNNTSTTNRKIVVFNKRQLIVRESGNRYITSYFVK